MSQKLIDGKVPIVLIFGYPNTTTFLGGTIWIKKVVDYIEKSKLLAIRKLNSAQKSKWRFFSRIINLYVVLKGFIINPDIAILDTYGDACLLMWIMFRFFRPSTKIVMIFHHYEPRSNKHRDGRIITLLYCRLLDLLTRIMLDNSDNIITVSTSSSLQLKNFIKINDTDKIVVAGCSYSKDLSVVSSELKDIDFLCVGRFEKFRGMEDIWKIIKQKMRGGKFVVVGRASEKDVLRLHKVGIEHKGIVSEDDKYKLYSRAKVLIFPSMFEGYGIAVTEALAAGMTIVAWKLPVFQERFGNDTSGVRLIEMGKLSLFAEEALSAIANRNKQHQSIVHKICNYPKSKSWQDVSEDVISVLEQCATIRY
jgi:glycosyltransferase involved in cell wall biosynthesis